MTGKRGSQQHSSFNEYVEAMHKLNPQLKSLLNHINAITANTPPNFSEGSLPSTPPASNNSPTPKDVTAGAPRKSSRCTGTTSTRKPCSRRRGGAMASNEQEVQAVTNSGKIVYGVITGDGQLEVKGHVGEVNEDLLGIDLDIVNGGRKTRTKRTSRKKRMSNDNSIDGGMA
ncbi:virion protein [Fowlpox virus]|uniref:25 kDa core protein OPG138 n=9 Tax=Fowlpox virus TaxID=10261 RepID=Q9J557_FOWPN|nr:Virion protein [Fowlpox virus]UNS14404.1 ALPV-240 [Albatrosspox virus]WPD90887.1 A12-like virion protein [Avipoxvirus sp.]CAE52713.1 A12L virion protein orthologue [Fowlpox virus isolate HP-438/Munich]AAF44520.1 ORF FPV176 Virion protein [Fowlpox virus]ART91609.1 A12L virion protein ortholog [Fowlpox virus]